MSWFSLADLAALLPVIALTVGALVVLIVDAATTSDDAKASLPYIAVGTIAAAAVAVAASWGEEALRGGAPLAASMHVGPFAAFISLVVLAAGAITVLSSTGYARALGFDVGEYYGLILFALAGMVYVSAANDLVTVFIAFELMSLAVYALAGIHRQDPKGYEGALKYFVMGAFASAFLLFGMALIYGATGTIYLDRMAWVGEMGSQGLVLTGLGLMLAGFAFKIGAVPFHSWVPDAYQGAPASVTGFMAVAVKAAAFAILIRVLAGTGILGAEASNAVTGALWGLAFMTMVVGNLIALVQENLKRLLAYSGIAHSGYVLVGVTAATRAGGNPEAAVSGALFYLAGYAAMTLGVFAVLTSLRQRGRDIEEVSDLGGLARERPVAAICLTLCLMSLVGMPPTVGFVGKLWVFKAAIESGLTGLVVVACLATGVSIYYYLRPVVVMYTAESQGLEHAPLSFGARAALAVTVLATLAFGILPSQAFEYAQLGARALVE